MNKVCNYKLCYVFQKRHLEKVVNIFSDESLFERRTFYHYIIYVYIYIHLVYTEIDMGSYLEEMQIQASKRWPLNNLVWLWCTSLRTRYDRDLTKENLMSLLFLCKDFFFQNVHVPFSSISRCSLFISVSATVISANSWGSNRAQGKPVGEFRLVIAYGNSLARHFWMAFQNIAIIAGCCEQKWIVAEIFEQEW